MDETNGSHAYAHARHPREEEYSAALDPTFIQGFYENWREIEDEINALQETKKAMLQGVRAKFGRHQSEAIRLTMRAMMMDPVKRAEFFHFNASAKFYVDMIEAGDFMQ